MYLSVRLETTRSQLFIMTSHTGIKPRCLFKLIPHKAFSLSDNLCIDLEHSQVFKVYCILKAFSQLSQHLISKHLYLTTSPGPAKLHTKQYRLSKVNFGSKFVGHPAVLKLGIWHQSSFAYYVHLAAWLNNNSSSSNHHRWIPSYLAPLRRN